MLAEAIKGQLPGLEVTVINIPESHHTRVDVALNLLIRTEVTDRLIRQADQDTLGTLIGRQMRCKLGERLLTWLEDNEPNLLHSWSMRHFMDKNFMSGGEVRPCSIS